jgi:hypothetical protein
MEKEVGLWIDHRQAIIVAIAGKVEEVKNIGSNVDKHVRFSGASAEDGSGEDVRDRKFDNQLNGFYDEIVAEIRDAGSILIFGPGEAKGELEKRLISSGVKADVIRTETVDKMTEGQVKAKVREQSHNARSG